MKRNTTSLDIRYSIDITETYPEADQVLNDYEEILEKKMGWGMDEIFMMGHLASRLFPLEFEINGTEAWKYSLSYFFRSLAFGRTQIDMRWPFLEGLPLEEPILDYGCGSGYLAAFIKKKTGKRTAGWDVPGAQSTLTKEVLNTLGIPWHKEGDTYGSVVCMNVLEHVSKPLETVAYLRSITPCLYANIDIHRDNSDLASEEDINATIRSLYQNGELLPLDGYINVLDCYPILQEPTNAVRS